MARSFLAGKLPFAVRGGYDFVDVRDVANGILACSESGEPGKGYILSGHYVTIRRMLQIIGAAAKRRYRPICLPLGLARLAAPYCERRSLKDRKPLFFTPYSISVLASNGRPCGIWPHGSLHRRKRARRCLISSGAPRSAAPAAELLCVSAFCSTSGLFLRVCCFLSLRLSSCFSSEIRIY